MHTTCCVCLVVGFLGRKRDMVLFIIFTSFPFTISVFNVSTFFSFSFRSCDLLFGSMLTAYSGYNIYSRMCGWAAKFSSALETEPGSFVCHCSDFSEYVFSK